MEAARRLNRLAKANESLKLQMSEGTTRAAEVERLRAEKTADARVIEELQKAKGQAAIDLNAKEVALAELQKELDDLKIDQKAKAKQLERTHQLLSKEKSRADKAEKRLAEYPAEEAARRTEYLNSREFQAEQLYPRIVKFTRLGARTTLQQLKELGHLPEDLPTPAVNLQRALDEAPADIMGTFD